MSETVYLSPEGKRVLPGKPYFGKGSWPAGAILKQTIRDIEGITTKVVTAPIYDPLTQHPPVQGDDGEYAQPQDRSFAEAMQRKLTDFQNTYEQKMEVLKSGVPESERDSWDKQEREAREWHKWNTTTPLPPNEPPTPFIDGLAASRGMDKETLVGKIIAKADTATAYSAQQTGILQKLSDEVEVEAAKQAPSVAALRVIVWPE